MERVTARERAYVQEVLDGGFRSSTGSAMTGRLEAEFARVFGSAYAISFINGTATLHAALAAAGVGPGHEVIVPPLTMASTAFAVLHAGALPVFADIDPAPFTLDPESVAACVTERTRAVVPVALYGLAPDLDPIMTIAGDHGLFVLEDDAQCFLGTYKGRLVGTIGHASSFSFQSSKHLASGEGGMIITDDGDLAERIRRFGSLGYQAVGAGAGQGKIGKEVIQDPGYERHASVGFNYRMSELCAAVALAQTERIEELVAARITAARALAEAAAGCSWLRPQHVPDGSHHVYWTWVAKLDNDGAFTWQDFRHAFVKQGGESLYGAWQLNYLEPAFRDQRFDAGQWQTFGRGLCPQAESVQPLLLQFKTNELEPAEVARQAEALQAAIAHFDGG